MRVLKKLKANKTRDPLGMINEIFKRGVIGQDLVSALAGLVSESKFNNFLPLFMRLANITSLYKRKGSKMRSRNICPDSGENDSGQIIVQRSLS